jgi:hypothetical protein
LGGFWKKSFVGLLYGLLFVSQPLIVTRFGLSIAIGGLSTYELVLMGIVCLVGCLIGMIPGYQIYYRMINWGTHPVAEEPFHFSSVDLVAHQGS